MASFVVLQHDDDPTAKASDKTVFVRDAFSIVALALPVIWLFWHRLWFAGTILLCTFVALFSLVQLPQYAAVILPLELVLATLVATEGPAWRIGILKRSGYKERGIVEAESLDDAQMIWGISQMSEISQIEKPMNLPNYRTQETPNEDLIFGLSGGGQS